MVMEYTFEWEDEDHTTFTKYSNGEPVSTFKVFPPFKYAMGNPDIKIVEVGRAVDNRLTDQNILLAEDEAEWLCIALGNVLLRR
jgi:hypothetical protein